MNLLKETLKILKDNNKNIDDVMWVGSLSGIYSISWEDFEKISNIEYDSGYGGQEIATDLIIVGNNWWLERGEYDGSEWWQYKELPIKKDNKKFKTVCNGDIWASIEEMNKPGGKYGKEE